MGEFIKVAKTNELVSGSAKTVDIGGTPVALFNVDGTFYAIHNTCVHRGGPLSEGSVDDAKQVACPWHGWQFDVTTGQCVTVPSKRLQTFAVKVEGDDVFIST